MAKYKIKATTLEAYKWTGTYDDKTTPRWLKEAQKKKGDELGAARVVNNTLIKVVTEHGIMTAYIGDYILRNDDGQLYPLNGRVLKLLNAEGDEA